MNLDVSSSKLTATPGASGWVQVHDFVPQNDEKLLKRGEIYAVIASKRSKEDGVGAVSLGREIITRLHEEYYANLEQKSFWQIKQAVSKIKQEFESINLEIGVIVYQGGNLFVVGCGGIVAEVLRGGSMVKLLETKGKIVSLSGKPKEGDIFLIGTDSFFSNFDQQELKESFTNNRFEKVVEEFAPKVHASFNLGSAGFLALKFGQSEEIHIEKINEQEQQAPIVQKESVVKSLFNKIPKRPIRLKQQNLDEAIPQGKKTTFTVGVVLLVLLVISVFFGINQKRNKDLEKTYGTKLESAISDYNEAVQLLALDKIRSRELFLLSKEKLEEVQSSNYKDERIEKLASDISEKQGEVLGEYKAQISNFLDLTLQTSGFEGVDMSSSSEDVFILDINNKQVIKVEISNKKASVVAGSDDVEDAKQVGSYEDRLFVARQDGIYELTSGEERIVEENMDNTLFYFYSANLYLLDKNNNTIFRFPGVTDGFEEKSDWLAPGIEADFSKVIDMAIDGSIWLLSSSGKVSRFTLGSPQSVSMEGLPEQMVNPTAIYTNEELENVYILDANKGRVVVLEKSGDFKVQYVSEEIKQAKDLVVSEEEGKIILLTGSKLMSVELRN